MPDSTVPWFGDVSIFLQFPMLTQVSVTNVKKRKKSIKSTPDVLNVILLWLSLFPCSDSLTKTCWSKYGFFLLATPIFLPKESGLWMITKITFWITIEIQMIQWLFSTGRVSPSQYRHRVAAQLKPLLQLLTRTLMQTDAIPLMCKFKPA